MKLSTHFGRQLERVLTERRETVASEIVGGQAEDFADYKRRVGEIAGIDRALNEAEEIERKMTAGERPQGTS